MQLYFMSTVMFSGGHMKACQHFFFFFCFGFWDAQPQFAASSNQVISVGFAS